MKIVGTIISFVQVSQDDFVNRSISKIFTSTNTFGDVEKWYRSLFPDCKKFYINDVQLSDLEEEPHE